MNKLFKLSIISLLIFSLSFGVFGYISCFTAETPVVEAGIVDDVCGLCHILHSDVGDGTTDWDAFWLCVGEMMS